MTTMLMMCQQSDTAHRTALVAVAQWVTLPAPRVHAYLLLAAADDLLDKRQHSDAAAPAAPTGSSDSSASARSSCRVSSSSRISTLRRALTATGCRASVAVRFVCSSRLRAGPAERMLVSCSSRPLVLHCAPPRFPDSACMSLLPMQMHR